MTCQTDAFIDDIFLVFYIFSDDLKTYSVFFDCFLKPVWCYIFKTFYDIVITAVDFLNLHTCTDVFTIIMQPFVGASVAPHLSVHLSRASDFLEIGKP